MHTSFRNVMDVGQSFRVSQKTNKAQVPTYSGSLHRPLVIIVLEVSHYYQSSRICSYQSEVNLCRTKSSLRNSFQVTLSNSCLSQWIKCTENEKRHHHNPSKFAGNLTFALNLRQEWTTQHNSVINHKPKVLCTPSLSSFTFSSSLSRFCTSKAMTWPSIYIEEIVWLTVKWTLMWRIYRV